MALYGAAGVLVAGGLYVAMHSSGSVNTPTSPGGWGQQHGAFRQPWAVAKAMTCCGASVVLCLTSRHYTLVHFQAHPFVAMSWCQQTVDVSTSVGHPNASGKWQQTI